VPVPASAPVISDDAIIGVPVPAAILPAGRSRLVRFTSGGGMAAFEKRSETHLDYVVDLRRVLSFGETITGAAVWTSAPADLIVTDVTFSEDRVAMFIAGGVDRTTYTVSAHIRTRLGATFFVQFNIRTAGDAANTLTTYRPPVLLTENDPDFWQLTDLRGNLVLPPLSDMRNRLLHGETLNLDFANDVYLVGGQLREFADIFSFNRSTVASVVASNGDLASAGVDVPRFTHDALTSDPLGLLTEGAATNILTNGAAPTNQIVNVTAQPHTLSFYGDGTVTISGAYSAVIAGAGAYPTRTTYSFLALAGVLTIAFSGAVSDAQLEADLAPSSLITSGAVATVRGADLAVMPQSVLYQWRNPLANTWIIEAICSAYGENEIWREDDGSDGNMIRLRADGTDLRLQIVTMGVEQVSISLGTISANTLFRAAFRIAWNDAAGCVDGGPMASEGSVVLPRITQAQPGADAIIQSIRVLASRMRGSDMIAATDGTTPAPVVSAASFNQPSAEAAWAALADLGAGIAPVATIAAAAASTPPLSLVKFFIPGIGTFGKATGNKGHAMCFQTVGGQWWDLQDEHSTFEAFGAVGNGIADDILAIEAAFLWQKITDRPLIGNASKYGISRGIVLTHENVSLTSNFAIAHNDGGCVIQKLPGFPDEPAMRLVNCSGAHISGIYFNGGDFIEGGGLYPGDVGTVGSYGAGDGLYLDNCSNITVSFCQAQNHLGFGMVFDGVWIANLYGNSTRKNGTRDLIGGNHSGGGVFYRNQVRENANHDIFGHLCNGNAGWDVYSDDGLLSTDRSNAIHWHGGQIESGWDYTHANVELVSGTRWTFSGTGFAAGTDTFRPLIILGSTDPAVTSSVDARFVMNYFQHNANGPGFAVQLGNNVNLADFVAPNFSVNRSRFINAEFANPLNIFGNRPKITVNGGNVTPDLYRDANKLVTITGIAGVSVGKRAGTSGTTAYLGSVINGDSLRLEVLDNLGAASYFQMGLGTNKIVARLSGQYLSRGALTAAPAITGSESGQCIEAYCDGVLWNPAGLSGGSPYAVWTVNGGSTWRQIHLTGAGGYGSFAAITATGTLTANAVTVTTSINAATLAVTGAATLSSTLAVTGAATLSSTLNVTGTATAAAFVGDGSGLTSVPPPDFGAGIAAMAGTAIGSTIVAWNATTANYAAAASVPGSSLYYATSAVSVFATRTALSSAFPIGGTTVLPGTWVALAYSRGQSSVFDPEGTVYSWHPCLFKRVS
jgi:hypothetical protein